jgi:TolA-binding protein
LKKIEIKRIEEKIRRDEMNQLASKSALLKNDLRSSSLMLAVICAVALSVFSLSSSAWGQAQLTVDNVIGMHNSKLPPQVIITTLKSSGAKFNLSLSDIKKLKKAGVPQDIIDMMSGGAQQGSEPEPEPEADPEAGETTQADQTEEEKKIAEAAKKAAEAAAAKKRAELKKARMAEINRRLQKAQEHLDMKRYDQALKAFDDFLQSDDQASLGSEGKAQAQFGLAESLFGLGLYANAMMNYEDILQTPPEENPVFERAFYRLRECSRLVSFVSLPGVLTDHYVGGFSQEFQDSYYYFLGKLFFAGSDFEQARIYLDKLGESKNKGPDYARAQYVLGLIAVNESVDDFTGLIKANRFFQQAITSAEREQYADQLRRIIHLSYLGLARIAYRIGTDIPASFDAAIFYYRKVPADSTNYIEALYESAWAYFLKGNIRRGMGIFHTLDGPDWEHHYLPDTHLLEAQVFLNLCRTKLAEFALNRLDKKYLKLKPVLSLYIDTYEDDVYNAFVGKKLKKGLDLPRRLYLAIVSDTRFNTSYSDLVRYSHEVEQIKKNKGLFGDELTTRLLESAESRLETRRELLSEKILEILRDRQEELEKLDDSVKRMRFEIEDQVASKLKQEINKSYDGDISSKAAANANSQTAANLLVGDKYQTWPFEGEFWADEINSYRSYLTNQCREDN